MLVPTVGSVVKVKVRDISGPRMIPPQPDNMVFEGTVIKSYPWLNDRQFCMTGDSLYPIRIISMNSVLDINMVSGTVKKVDTEDKVFEVSGSKGNKYIVTSNSKSWTCTCPGFQFRNQCKHISELSASKKGKK